MGGGDMCVCSLVIVLIFMGIIVVIDVVVVLDEEINVQNLLVVEVMVLFVVVWCSVLVWFVVCIGVLLFVVLWMCIYVYLMVLGIGWGFDVDKVFLVINVVDVGQIRWINLLIVFDVLCDNILGVYISEVIGNFFMLDVEFCGFVVLFVVGMLQGFVVYQNGVCINEVFFDVVNWDLILIVVIRLVMFVINNFVFGFNVFGGVFNLQMKDGFIYQGVEVDVMGGLFGCIQGLV